MEIRPIRNEADHRAALATIESLWDALPGTREHDQLDVLATLVDTYERTHVPIAPPDPIDAIKFRLEQGGLTRKELEVLIGTRARVAEILNRKRTLTLAMIRALHRALGIPLESLVAETGAKRSRGAKRARAGKAAPVGDVARERPSRMAAKTSPSIRRSGRETLRTG